jgi:hypothetical protein
MPFGGCRCANLYPGIGVGFPAAKVAASRRCSARQFPKRPAPLQPSARRLAPRQRRSAAGYLSHGPGEIGADRSDFLQSAGTQRFRVGALNKVPHFVSGHGHILRGFTPPDQMFRKFCSDRYYMTLKTALFWAQNPATFGQKPASQAGESPQIRDAILRRRRDGARGTHSINPAV